MAKHKNKAKIVLKLNEHVALHSFINQYRTLITKDQSPDSPVFPSFTTKKDARYPSTTEVAKAMTEHSHSKFEYILEDYHAKLTR